MLQSRLSLGVITFTLLLTAALSEHLALDSNCFARNAPSTQVSRKLNSLKRIASDRPGPVFRVRHCAEWFVPSEISTQSADRIANSKTFDITVTEPFNSSPFNAIQEPAFFRRDEKTRSSSHHNLLALSRESRKQDAVEVPFIYVQFLR